jgi:predicted ATPase
MVAHILGTEDLERDLEELILEKTEGVPFFIEEFLKSLKDLKIIEKKDNKYYLTKEIKDLAIPSAIQDMIMSRVDSLPEGGKDILQTGSVAGREFTHSLIEMLMDLSERELLSHLSLLKDAELLYERGIYPQSTYIFKHALIQDATYQSLLKSTRKKYHQKIAQVLEKHFPESVETQPERLAYHYSGAGLNEEAVGYWHQAGKRAAQRSAYEEAINHLTMGLEALMTLPDTLARSRQELDMQTSLGPLLMAVKGQACPDAKLAYTRARELCQQVGETPRLFPVLYGLFRFHLVRSELQTARELAEQLLSLAKRAEEPALLLEAHRNLGQTLYWLGEMSPARVHSEKGMAIYDSQKHCSHAFVYGQDPGVACQSVGAFPIWVLGYPDKALQNVHEALTLAQDLAHPFSIAFALVNASVLHQYRREVPAVQKRAEAVIELSTKHGFPQWLANGTILRGWVLTMRGEQAEGIASINQGLVTRRAKDLQILRPYFLSLLAEAYGIVRQPEKGLKVLVEALVAVDNTGERYWEAELHRRKGELVLIQQGQKVGEAEECFRQAIEIASRQQAKSLELRAVMSLSRLWRQQGKRKNAYELLAPIYEWFTEGFDTPDLKGAKALLEELSA